MNQTIHGIAADVIAAPVEDFKLAMRALAATVTLVTAGRDGRRSGLVVTAACSLCMEPPSMVICVNRASNTHRRIVEEGRFGVNLLSNAYTHQELVSVFSDSTLAGEDKFRTGDWLRIADGAPLLADALASIDCQVLERVDMGTHTIFIGAVRQVLNRPEKGPLLYANKQLVTLALPAALH